MAEHRDPVRTAQDLTEAMNGLAARVEGLGTYGRRNRLLLAALAVLLVLAAAALALGIVAARQSATARAVASANHAGNLAACRAGNTFRAEQIALWARVARVSKHQPGETRAQARKRRQTTAAFLAYVRKVNAARDCQAVYRLP